MKETEYAERVINCWLANEQAEAGGSHRNNPNEHVVRAATDGVTLFSYGEPIAHRYNGHIILNATPYVIDNGRKRVISKTTYQLQAHVAKRLYNDPALRAITLVVDLDPRGSYSTIDLERLYHRNADGGTLTTLESYIANGDYTAAYAAARAELGRKTPRNATYQLFYPDPNIIYVQAQAQAQAEAQAQAQS